jgi:hypothetical protein
MTTITITRRRAVKLRVRVPANTKRSLTEVESVSEKFSDFSSWSV